jgi:hypothetical protein
MLPVPRKGSMSRPARSPEATQEIDASDVLEVSDPPRARRPDPVSSPSIRPVGIDVQLARYRQDLLASLEAREAAERMGRGDETCQLRLVARRRELSRYVIGAVAVSCAILVASLVKHESRAAAGSQSSAAEVGPHPLVTPRPAARPSYAGADIPPPPPAVALPTPATTPQTIPTVPSTQTTQTVASGSGTLRFTSPARSWIWVDGKRLTGTSAIVSCGTHQIKVGYYAKHAVVVPCDGELVLSH